MNKPGRFSSMNQPIKCACCGKSTQSMVDGCIGTDLCRDCYEDAGQENEHNDCHDPAAPEADCRFCMKVG